MLYQLTVMQKSHLLMNNNELPVTVERVVFLAHTVYTSCCYVLIDLLYNARGRNYIQVIYVLILTLFFVISQTNTWRKKPSNLLMGNWGEQKRGH